MNPIGLNDTLQFCIEPFENRLRVVVLKDGVEWVCRKESFSKMNRFLNDNTNRIFKGRLQLIKSDHKITVEVKGETVGIIDSDYIRQHLIELKQT